MPTINKYVGVTPQELKEIDQYFEKMNCEKISEGDGIEKIPMKISEDLSAFEAAPIAEDGNFYKTQYDPVEKVNKTIEFQPGDRVNIKQMLRNHHDIPKKIFEFGAIILNIHTKYMGGGSIEKVYSLEEYIPINHGYEHQPIKQYLEFTALNDQIDYFIELWDEHKIVNTKTKIKTHQASDIIRNPSEYWDRVDKIRGQTNNYQYYDDIPSTDIKYDNSNYCWNEPPEMSDEQIILEKKKIQEQINNHWKKKEIKPRGHPLTNQFKREEVNT